MLTLPLSLIRRLAGLRSLCITFASCKKPKHKSILYMILIKWASETILLFYSIVYKSWSICVITRHNWFKLRLFYFSLSIEHPVFKISDEQVALELGVPCSITGTRIVINSVVNIRKFKQVLN